MLEVEDSGLGIASAKRELMFGRFARLDDKTHGSGLGLAIVRDVAAAHGARVAIDELGGGGALFSISFPLMFKIYQKNLSFVRVMSAFHQGNDSLAGYYFLEESTYFRGSK